MMIVMMADPLRHRYRISAVTLEGEEKRVEVEMGGKARLAACPAALLEEPLGVGLGPWLGKHFAYRCLPGVLMPSTALGLEYPDDLALCRAKLEASGEDRACRRWLRGAAEGAGGPTGAV
jgi:hypothetical protein